MVALNAETRVRYAAPYKMKIKQTKTITLSHWLLHHRYSIEYIYFSNAFFKSLHTSLAMTFVKCRNVYTLHKPTVTKVM